MHLRSRPSFPISASKKGGQAGEAASSGSPDGRAAGGSPPEKQPHASRFASGGGAREASEGRNRFDVGGRFDAAVSVFGCGSRRAHEPSGEAAEMRTPVPPNAAQQPPSTVGGSPPSGAGTVVGLRRYDDEKSRVPSWCDRVLWRSLPGATSLASTGSSDCDDPQFYASDHAPVHTIFDVDLPVLPTDLPLHHCTIYLSNLALYRARPRRLSSSGMADPAPLGGGGNSLSARTNMGKGVPLPVAGAKLQNLPPQLTVYAHLLVLHKLLSEPPHHAAALTQDGRSATNIGNHKRSSNPRTRHVAEATLSFGPCLPPPSVPYGRGSLRLLLSLRAR